MEPHVNDTETPTVEPQAHAHVDETETPNLNKYYGLDLETLEALLSNDDIIDIQPISIDTSPIKKTIYYQNKFNQVRWSQNFL